MPEGRLARSESIEQATFSPPGDVEKSQSAIVEIDINAHNGKLPLPTRPRARRCAESRVLCLLSPSHSVWSSLPDLHPTMEPIQYFPTLYNFHFLKVRGHVLNMMFARR